MYTSVLLVQQVPWGHLTFLLFSVISSCVVQHNLVVQLNHIGTRWLTFSSSNCMLMYSFGLISFWRGNSICTQLLIYLPSVLLLTLPLFMYLLVFFYTKYM
jgi:hypothetical protein